MKLRHLWVGLVALLLTVSANSANAGLIITGLGDGPLSNGTPKVIELYVDGDIADLSVYKLDLYSNANVAPTGSGFTFPAVAATNGTFIYVASEAPNFTSFFGFAPTYINSVTNFNGDDSVQLLQSGVPVDLFGVIGTDGTGQPWEYLDGWVYRVDGTGPSVPMNLSNYTFSGNDQLEGGLTNATTTSPFPLGTYTPAAVPEPSSVVLSVLAGLGFLGYRVGRKIA